MKKKWTRPQLSQVSFSWKKKCWKCLGWKMFITDQYLWREGGGHRIKSDCSGGLIILSHPSRKLWSEDCTQFPQLGRNGQAFTPELGCPRESGALLKAALSNKNRPWCVADSGKLSTDHTPSSWATSTFFFFFPFLWLTLL